MRWKRGKLLTLSPVVLSPPGCRDLRDVEDPDRAGRIRSA